MTELVEALSTAGRPHRSITLADWDDLPDDDGYRVEVGEGVLTVVPPAHRRHGVALIRLAAQVDAQLLADHHIAAEADVTVCRDPLILTLDLDLTR